MKQVGKERMMHMEVEVENLSPRRKINTLITTIVLYIID